MENKEEIVLDILDRAEQRPWKVESAILGKLPAVYMRTKKIDHDKAVALTLELINKLGSLDDGTEILEIREKLLTLIDLD